MTTGIIKPTYLNLPILVFSHTFYKPKGKLLNKNLKILELHNSTTKGTLNGYETLTKNIQTNQAMMLLRIIKKALPYSLEI